MANDTKTLIISVATSLFQQKGYIGVGLNEILKECNLSKGSFYHHFQNGKEELLIACLHSLNETITTDMVQIFSRYPTVGKATNAMIEKMIVNFEAEGTLSGYTFSSIVSEMAALSDAVRDACGELYEKMQAIYFQKLLADGISEEKAKPIALFMTASIEGGMMLCLTKKTSDPLKHINQLLPKAILI